MRTFSLRPAPYACTSIAEENQAFNDEDKPIIEATYANMDGADFWDCKPVFLGIDAGGTSARRLLQKLIQKEETAQ